MYSFSNYHSYDQTTVWGNRIAPPPFPWLTSLQKWAWQSFLVGKNQENSTLAVSRYMRRIKIYFSTYSLESGSQSKEDSETERKQQLPGFNQPLILHRQQNFYFFPAFKISQTAEVTQKNRKYRPEHRLFRLFTFFPPCTSISRTYLLNSAPVYYLTSSFDSFLTF
jgi:hypothetical protein